MCLLKSLRNSDWVPSTHLGLKLVPPECEAEVLSVDAARTGKGTDWRPQHLPLTRLPFILQNLASCRTMCFCHPYGLQNKQKKNRTELFRVVTTTRCGTAQKNAVLIYFATEAWNQANKKGFPMLPFPNCVAETEILFSLVGASGFRMMAYLNLLAKKTNIWRRQIKFWTGTLNLI